MAGSERLRTVGLLALVLGLGLSACRSTPPPQPVTRADAAKDPKAAAPASPAPGSAAPAAPPAAQEERHRGDAAPVVVDPGVDGAKTPATLVEAARAERERRAGAGKPIAVINDKTLPKYASKGQITFADPKKGKVKEKDKQANALAAAAAAQERDEQYWRGRARRLRESWHQAADEVKDLEQKSAELRQKFYGETDTFLRDTQIKPDWDRVLDRLRQARLDVEAARQDVAKFLEEGRAAGALPGWLDEGIEEEPEEAKKKDTAPAAQSIEPPVLNSDDIRTPPPGAGR